MPRTLPSLAALPTRRPPLCPFYPPLCSRAEGLNQFLEYASSMPNVFFVTVTQVLDWMKNPGE